MLREDFAALARWSRQPDFPDGVQALFGYTLLNEAAPRLGFTVRERPHTLVTWLDRLFMTGCWRCTIRVAARGWRKARPSARIQPSCGCRLASYSDVSTPPHQTLALPRANGAPV